MTKPLGPFERPADRQRWPRPDEERVWLAFAQAAVGGLSALHDMEDPQIARDAARIADLMIERWRERYDPSEPVVVAPDEVPLF